MQQPLTGNPLDWPELVKLANHLREDKYRLSCEPTHRP